VRKRYLLLSAAVSSLSVAAIAGGMWMRERLIEIGPTLGWDPLLGFLNSPVAGLRFTAWLQIAGAAFGAAGGLLMLRWNRRRVS
jgi:hypothetical protein